MAGCLVLMYHRLGQGELEDREPGEHTFAVEEAMFARHLEALARTGCAVIGPAELSDSIRHARLLPRRAVLLTFDDGNASDSSLAFPRLAERGWPALFFVSPALVGRPGYADWNALREMAVSGMTIGAHGLDHTPLSHLDDAALASQLSEARRQIEDRIGREARYLSFPHGLGGTREIGAARAAGFEVVYGSVPGRAGGHGAATVPRVAIRSSDSLSAFQALVAGKPLALFRRTVRHRALSLLRAGLGERLYGRVRNALVPAA